MKAAEQYCPMARGLLCSRNKFYVWICGSNPYVSLFNKKLSSSTFFGVILLFKHLLSSLVYVLLPLYFHISTINVNG